MHIITHRATTEKITEKHIIIKINIEIKAKKFKAKEKLSKKLLKTKGYKGETERKKA